MASLRLAAAQTTGPTRTPAQAAAHRLGRADSWSNVITGINTSRDRSTSNQFDVDLYTQAENEELYRSSDMAARIVETIPDEMCREGFELLVDEDKDLAEDVGGAADELGVLSHVHEALRWRRAYGGAGIVLGVDDGQDPTEPLNLDAIRSFTWMTVLSPLELQPMAWYDDPLGPKFGEPRIYRVQPLFTPGSGLVSIVQRSNAAGPFSLVHESRVIRFDGIKVSRRQLYEGYNFGWGDSILNRCRRRLGRFDLSWDSAETLIEDFAQAVYKLNGLADLVASRNPADNAAVVKRMQLIDQSRSVLRGVLLDAENEDFERKPTPITGLPDLLDKLCLRLAAAANMPVSLLMGQAPAGLNATGDSDIRWFYDKVKSWQRQDMVPKLRRILQLLMRAKAGPTGGVEPDNWSIKLPSLWQLSETEQADARLKNAQADEIYISNQVLTPEEVAQSRFGGDEYSAETVLDQDTRDDLEKAQAALPGAPGQGEPGSDEPIDSGIDDPNAVNPKAALQGPQTLAMLQIVQAVVSKSIPRDAGVQLLVAAFPLSPEDAEKVMGTAGQGFEPPPKPVPPANPFMAGGMKPPEPGAKPPLPGQKPEPTGPETKPPEQSK